MIFFIKNPNLKKKKFFCRGGGEVGGVDGAGGGRGSWRGVGPCGGRG